MVGAAVGAGAAVVVARVVGGGVVVGTAVVVARVVEVEVVVGAAVVVARVVEVVVVVVVACLVVVVLDVPETGCSTVLSLGDEHPTTANNNAIDTTIPRSTTGVPPTRPGELVQIGR